MKRYVTILALALLLVAIYTGVAMAAPGAQGGPSIHYVGFGDNLNGIAARYGVSVEAIMRANGLANPDMIYVGQPLRIPGPAGYGSPGVLPNPYGGDCASYHIVRAGDTLSGVAWQYGVPVEELLRYNRLYNRDIVYEGQRLCVSTGSRFAPQPANYYDVAPSAESYYHRVAAGETCSSIADRYGVDYGSIIRANNLGYDGFIYEGQRLMIPGYHPAPPQLPPPAAPPPHPHYDDASEKVYDGPPPPPHDGRAGEVPAAPDYQSVPLKPELPLASQPIEVVVNGGQSWVGEAFPSTPDPNEITTLVVGTANKDENWTVYVQSGDYLVKGEMGLTPEFGIDQYRFGFKYIPPGDYDVWIDDPETPSDKVQVKVEAGQRVTVEFRKGLAFSGPTFASPDGWYLADWNNPSVPHENRGGWSNIVVNTPAPGLWVKIRSEGNGYEAKCFTGTKGPGSCDFAGLNAGIYFIWIDGTDLTLKTYMDGSAYATFTFARQAVSGDEDLVGPVSYD